MSELVQVPEFKTKSELKQALFEAGNGGYYLHYYTDHWDELPELTQIRLLGLPIPKCLICNCEADFKAWIRQPDSSVMVRHYCNKCAEDQLIAEDIIQNTTMVQDITRRIIR